MLEATGSAARAGVVGSVLAGTAFLLRLPAGVLVDRWNRRAILLVCDAGRAASAAGLAAALALGHFFFVQVLLVAVVEAALGVLFGPAEAAAVRRVVAPEQIATAVARNESRSAIPGLVGPSVAGALLAAARSLPFVGDAISYVVSLVCIACVRTPLGGGARVAGDRPLAALAAGLRWIWPRRFLRAFLLWSLGAGVVYSSIGLVALVLARDHGASPAQLGAMFTIASAGAVAGALAAPRLRRRVPARALVVAYAWVASATMILLLAAADSPYAMGVLGAAATLLAPAVNTIASTVIAEEADDELQGRATSAANQLARFGVPLGPVAAGFLLAAVGPSTAVVVDACALAGLAAIATLGRGLRS